MYLHVHVFWHEAHNDDIGELPKYIFAQIALNVFRSESSEQLSNLGIWHFAIKNKSLIFCFICIQFIVDAIHQLSRNEID